MARKPIPVPDDDDTPKTDAELMVGNPLHGPNGTENPDDPDNDDGVVDDDGDAGASPRPDWQDAMDDLRRENSQMLQQLILAMAQGRGAPTTPEASGLPADADIEDLMFRDPAKLVQLIEQNVSRKVEAQLTSKYREETGRSKFWDKFYSKHNDLEDDRDLVDATLAKHMSDLKDMPVDRAIERLATLTRTRIAGYVANRRTVKKAIVESGGAPAGRTGATPAAAQPVVAQTLSQALRQRALRRSSRGRAA